MAPRPPQIPATSSESDSSGSPSKTPVLTPSVHCHRQACRFCQLSGTVDTLASRLPPALTWRTEMKNNYGKRHGNAWPGMHRARVKAQEDLAEAARARARQASKKYRETHAAQLAHRQRIVRMEAYERKHGHRAWLARYEKLQAQREAARELEEMQRYEEEFRRRDAEAGRRSEVQV
ncbi:hypothetical protein DFH06DRAFT_1315587 [Mycena polygramma]|nr:hypothetical protein DFH06DRAFT_1315587 [Mycena polygramma]